MSCDGNRPGMRLEVGHFGVGEEALRRQPAAARGERKDYPPGQEPIVFAGLKVTNSDVGEGARSIAPEIVVQICGNRLTLTAADRAVHLGSQKDEGVIQWSSAPRKRTDVRDHERAMAPVLGIDPDQARTRPLHHHPQGRQPRRQTVTHILRARRRSAARQ